MTHGCLSPRSSSRGRSSGSRQRQRPLVPRIGEDDHAESKAVAVRDPQTSPSARVGRIAPSPSVVRGAGTDSPRAPGRARAAAELVGTPLRSRPTWPSGRLPHRCCTVAPLPVPVRFRFGSPHSAAGEPFFRRCAPHPPTPTRSAAKIPPFSADPRRPPHGRPTGATRGRSPTGAPPRAGSGLLLHPGSRPRGRLLRGDACRGWAGAAPPGPGPAATGHG